MVVYKKKVYYKYLWCSYVWIKEKSFFKHIQGDQNIQIIFQKIEGGHLDFQMPKVFYYENFLE